jgi:colanic acid biosynthesis glycosyl transferase WcaI
VTVRLAVVCPHFSPDSAPTGEVITRIVVELAERGHELHVVTALPYYEHHRVDRAWRGALLRRERTAWGTVTRLHPFPTDKTSLPRRALGFGAFSILTGVVGALGRRVDGVLAMSPPLPLGLVGWGVHLVRRGPVVFNVQDVFPDVAIELGKLTNQRLIDAARWLERTTYRRVDAVTVLSGDLLANVAAKLPPAERDKVRVIPNFVDTAAIRPGDRATAYRRELGIGDETVVMYAGNIGFSQSLALLVEAARRLRERDDVVFVVNGGGSGLADLRDLAAGLANVRFAPYQPKARLAEVLASGDVHLVPLRRGLGHASVPSKTYSILAAGRPLVASIDPDTEVTRIVAASGAGIAVPPDDPDAFASALEALVEDEAGRRAMGERGRAWVERSASPAAVAEAYESLFDELARQRGGRSDPGPARPAAGSGR